MTRTDCRYDLEVSVRGVRLPRRLLSIRRPREAPMAMLRFGTWSFPTVAYEGCQMRAGVSRLRILEPFPHLTRNSRFELIGKLRRFFGILGVLVGICAYSPSVMGESEEVSSQDRGKSGYEIPTIFHELMKNIAGYEEEEQDNTIYELPAIDNSHGDTEYTIGRHTFSYSGYQNGFNDALIPEAVWSIDASAGVHLDRISGELVSETSAIFGGRLERTDFRSRTTFGLWDDRIKDQDLLSIINPALFQVASCGGGHAERSNLEYCENNGIVDKINDNSKSGENDKGNSTIQETDGGISTSSVTSLSSPVTPSNSAPLMPANPSMSGDLTLLGRCDGVSCAPIHIEPPATLIDSSAPEFPTPPIDDQTLPIHDQTPPIHDPTPPIGDPTPPIGDPTPPNDLPPPEVVPPIPGNSIGDLGPGLNQQRPIPEASTWVMTIIGFGAIIFVFRKKKRDRINSISIIDNVEIKL
jgi:hypothetical protein